MPNSDEPAPAKCQDYFIKDGRHIGRYDEMYRACPDPWRIQELGLRLDMEAALLLLSHIPPPIEEVLDLGAGAGFFSEKAIEKISENNPGAKFTLLDISPTALAQAQERLSRSQGHTGGVSFLCLDLRKGYENEKTLAPNSFRLIIMAQVLWGILESLEATLSGLARLARPKGYLLVSQHFPGEKNQSYGAELAKSPEDLSRYLSKAGFSLLSSLETDRATNHHWAGLWQRNS